MMRGLFDWLILLKLTKYTEVFKFDEMPLIILELISLPTGKWKFCSMQFNYSLLELDFAPFKLNSLFSIILAQLVVNSLFLLLISSIPGLVRYCFSYLGLTYGL